MTRWLAPLLCLLVVRVSAQDKPGGSSDFGGEWDAIMQLSPPEAHATAKPAEAEQGKRPQRTKEGQRSSEGSRSRERQNGRGRRSSSVSSGYDALKRSWHEPWPEESSTEPALGVTLHPVGKAAPVHLSPVTETGGFDAAQLAAASEALGSWSGGPVVAERLVELIYHAAQQFGVAHVHVVSGVRRDRSGSRHSHGLAADIVLPGVDDEELAAYFRAQGFVGVGVYTRAGFVHIDVREKSFFWIDRSPPGRRYKIQSVRADEAKAADEAAIARGQQGFVNPERLNRALSARAKRRRTKREAGKSQVVAKPVADR